MAQNTVKCSFCGTGVVKTEAVRYKNKNYHSNCADLQQQREELTDYICRLFSLKSPGPRIYTQIKNFLEKKPIEKANQGIGIVPYVYDSAQEYFNNIIMRQERVATEISSALSVATQEVKIKRPEKKKKNLYNIENL